MNNVFNTQTINQFKNRIEQLTPDSQAEWGKMNAYQMLKHCTENDRMLLREKDYKRLFIGRLFGKLALKSTVKNDAPLSKNSPTHPELVIKENGNFEDQKKQWLKVLDLFPTKSEQDYQDYVHPFYGKMNMEKVNIFAYKHIDHHLRQFGV